MYLARGYFTGYYLLKEVFSRLGIDAKTEPERPIALMPETKVKERKRIFLFLRIGVVAAGITWAVIWLSRGQRWNNLTAVFHRMNLGVFAAALGVFIVCQLMIAFRWWLLLRTQSIFIDLWPAARLHFLGLFYNNFMPGAVGGDLLRAWYVTKHTDKKFHAVLSVFVDRVVGLLGSLIIAVFFYLFFMRRQSAKAVLDIKSGLPLSFVKSKQIILWVAIVLVAVFCSLLLYKRSRLLLKNAWLFIQIRCKKLLEKFKDAVVLYCRKPRAILSVFGLTFFLQLLTITGFWFLGRNLGIEVGIIYYYVFFPFSWALGAIPVSIGGAVVVEGILAYLFIQLAGVGAEAALALVLCQRIVWMIASLPGAVIHLVGAHLPAPAGLPEDFSQS